MSSDNTKILNDISCLKREVVSEHASSAVTWGTNLLFIDAILWIKLFEKLSDKEDIIITCKGVASSAFVQSVATQVAIWSCFFSTNSRNATVTVIPTGPSTLHVVLFLIIGHASWIDGDDVLVVDVWKIGEVVAPPVEPEDDWVLLGWIVVLRKVNFVPSVHCFV